jgi:hypothetical protein
MTSPQKIARLAIALDEVKPPVRRRVEVQLAVRLDQLHRIIQIVMGWESYHLYEFRVGRDVVYGISYRDRDFPGTSPLSAKKVRRLVCREVILSRSAGPIGSAIRKTSG